MTVRYSDAVVMRLYGCLEYVLHCTAEEKHVCFLGNPSASMLSTLRGSIKHHYWRLLAFCSICIPLLKEFLWLHRRCAYLESAILFSPFFLPIFVPNAVSCFPLPSGLILCPSGGPLSSAAWQQNNLVQKIKIKLKKGIVFCWATFLRGQGSVWCCRDSSTPSKSKQRQGRGEPWGRISAEPLCLQQKPEDTPARAGNSSASQMPCTNVVIWKHIMSTSRHCPWGN